MSQPIEKIIEHLVAASISPQKIKAALIQCSMQHPDRKVTPEALLKVLADASMPKYKNYKYEKHYIRYETPEAQLEGLKKLLVNLITDAYLYETEDIEAGKKYIEQNKNKASLDSVKKNATLELEMMISEAEALASEDKILEMLFDSSTVEAVGPGTPENALVIVPINELVIDPKGIAGKLNLKNVPDLYEALGEGLYEEDVEELAARLPLNAEWDWRNDLIKIPVKWDRWAAIVDEDSFEEKLVAMKGEQQIKAVQ